MVFFFCKSKFLYNWIVFLLFLESILLVKLKILCFRDLGINFWIVFCVIVFVLRVYKYSFCNFFIIFDKFKFVNWSNKLKVLEWIVYFLFLIVWEMYWWIVFLFIGLMLIIVVFFFNVLVIFLCLFNFLYEVIKIRIVVGDGFFK